VTAGFRIRIRIGSAFLETLDPDPHLKIQHEIQTLKYEIKRFFYIKNSFNFVDVFVKMFDKRYMQIFSPTISPLKIRPWIRIRIRIGFQNPGSGSARTGCGSEP